MFLRDYPRRLANRLWLGWFAALDPFPVAAALPVAFLLTGRALSVTLLRFPPRPFPRFLPAVLAAIPLARLPRSKLLLAPSEQTMSRSQPSPAALWLCRCLLFARACRTLGRAHGRSRLPEAPALERDLLPSGAQ